MIVWVGRSGVAKPIRHDPAPCTWARPGCLLGLPISAAEPTPITLHAKPATIKESASILSRQCNHQSNSLH